ncbi:hypothetical protein ABFV05_010579 [Capra hircus]
MDRPGGEEWGRGEGFLSSRIPPCAPHLLTARPATARLSAGAGANPIYRPGLARPARMRRRLTPPDSALPSPARPPPARARRAAPWPPSAPAPLEGPQGWLTAAPCPSPARAARRQERPSQEGSAPPPPPQPCSPPLDFINLPPASRNPGFLRRREDPKGPPPAGGARRRGTGELANGRRGRRHSVEPPGELANGRRGRRHNVELLQNVNTAQCAAHRMCRRAPRVSPRAPPGPTGTPGSPRHRDACLALFSSAPAEIISHNDASSMCPLSRFSRVQLFATPWTVACQAPLSTGFSRLAGGKMFWLGSFSNSCSDAVNRCHQERPSPLLASWQNRLHSRGSITASEIQSLSLFPWADTNRKPLECRTRTSEFTADVRWRAGKAGRKGSKQWTNGLLTDTHFPKYNFTGRI